MDDTKPSVEEQFLKNIATHEMSILMEQNTYRHLRFKRPQSGIYWFDIVTWPGYLAYSGDMGCFVFKRVHDMLTFFRGKRREGHLDINPQYWAEKLRAVDRDGREGSFEEYSEAKMRQNIEEHVQTWIDEFDVPHDEEDELTEAQSSQNVEARKAFGDEVRAAVKSEVLYYPDDGEYKAREMVNNFKVKIGDQTYEFHDSSEWRCRDYTLRFIWCCYALVWAIEKYDAAKAEVPAETLT